MDSNKNEQCCFNTNTHGGHVAAGRSDIIETGCIAKTVSAAKYQNQFNNNNLIEQENLMPAVKQDDPPAVMVGQNGGGAGGVPSDLHAKGKVFAVNGQASPSVSATFSPSSSSSSSSVSVARNASEERVPSGQQSVECLTNTTTTSSFTPAINGTGPGYIRPTSTSTSESLPRSSNADHSLDPSVAVVGGGPSERRDELTAEAVAKVKPDDAAGPGAPDDGDFSDNNSIGNLSYISENGLIEEIILLPNNAYSDDDNASTSDDCIYAYRGGEPGGAAGLLLELRGDQPPDDETDFLEMDFDPEPSSEMENFDSSQQEQVLEEDGLAAASSSLARANDAQLSPEASSSNSPRANGSLVRTLSESEASQHIVAGPSHSSPAGDHAPKKTPMEGVLAATSPVSSPGPSATAVPLQRSAEEKQEVKEIHDTGGKVESAVCNKTDEPSNRSQAHKTGAIPKAVPQQYASPERDRTPGGRCSSNAKNLKLDLNLCLDGIDGSDGGAKRRYLDHLLYYDRPQTYSDGQSWAEKLVADSEESASREDFEFYCTECGNLEFTSKLWMDHEPAGWVCKNCVFAQDEKLFRRRPDAFRQRAHGPKDQQETEPTSPGDVEAFDIRAEQIAMEALSKINTLKELPPSSGRLSWQEEQQYSRNRSIMVSNVRQHDQLQDQEVPYPDNYHHGVANCPENTVTIYTINCGELTIIEALTRIGIAPNLDVLRQYFTEQYHVDTSKMNIPQYLLHMSKRDCNYKKLIEAIKSCCDDETLDVQYYPFDPFTDMPEIVQISSCEIAKRWNANTNLRQIIHFKHKHFHTLNVLGKIVNIIRQPSRGRHTSHTIGIPQYYKSGSVTITRATGSS
uniref:Uncharacterized protein n=1 Tax=Anopheles atroparvus TaxID=41427 RepID=A0A182IJ15_ANOAO